MQAIQDAVDNDVLVVIKSQCHHGGVDDVYAAGRFLTNLGCILSQDMTTECLFAKLSYLIGKVSISPFSVTTFDVCTNSCGDCMDRGTRQKGSRC